MNTFFHIILSCGFMIVNVSTQAQPGGAPPNESGHCYAKCLIHVKGITEWKEVICESDINKTLVRSLQDKLKSLGYFTGIIDDKIGVSTKAALVRFQQDYNLPIGSLDYETLISLGVLDSTGKLPPDYQTNSNQTLCKAICKIDSNHIITYQHKDIICENKVTPYQIKQLQIALKFKGYDPGDDSTSLTPFLKNALLIYQQEVGLPQCGCLELETLNSLGFH